MNAEAIRTAVLATLRTIAPELDPAAIDAERPLRGQIDLDSMDWLNVIAGLQERFGLTIAETDYGKLQTLGGIVAYLAERLPTPAAG